MFICWILILGLATGGLASLQHSSSLAHVTGCGCTTTTTCSPGAGSNACSQGVPRPGKRGPVGAKGAKGEKGAPSESNHEEISQLQNRIDQLNDDLKVFWELSYSFPSTCSEYIRHEAEHRKFERVPLYLGKSTGNMTTIIANCTRVENIHGPVGFASIGVPFNSVLGRTLILKATPQEINGNSVFNVNFKGDGSYVFHIAVRFTYGDIVNQLARNDRPAGAKWKAEEHDILTDFPFSIGVPFTMKITVDEVGYHCFVDGTKIFVFNHRQMSPSEIKTVATAGPLSVAFMSFN